METNLRKIGNSQGLLLPKPLLAQLGIEDRVELRVRDGVLEVRPARTHRREGWAQAAAQLAQEADEGLVWPEFSNEDDSRLIW